MKRMNWFYGALLLLLTCLPLLGFAETNKTIYSVPGGIADETAVALQSAASLRDSCPMAGNFQGAVGIYAKNLKTGQVLTLNPDDVFAAASTVKVPVSVIIYRHFYSQSNPNVREDYDVGIELMMTISDNEYFAEFLDEIEDSISSEVIQQHFALLGMEHTTIRDPQARDVYGYSNVTTARDMGVFFEQFYLGKLIDAEKTNFMKDAMTDTAFEDELPRYMQNRRVIHKVGELDDVLADVGIVEGESGPVLISIFTETPLDIDYASDYIAAVSACVYQCLSGETTAWQR